MFLTLASGCFLNWHEPQYFPSAESSVASVRLAMDAELISRGSRPLGHQAMLDQVRAAVSLP